MTPAWRITPNEVVKTHDVHCLSDYQRNTVACARHSVPRPLPSTLFSPSVLCHHHHPLPPHSLGLRQVQLLLEHRAGLVELPENPGLCTQNQSHQTTGEAAGSPASLTLVLTFSHLSFLQLRKFNFRIVTRQVNTNLQIGEENPDRGFCLLRPHGVYVQELRGSATARRPRGSAGRGRCQ